MKVEKKVAVELATQSPERLNRWWKQEGGLTLEFSKHGFRFRIPRSRNLIWRWTFGITSSGTASSIASGIARGSGSASASGRNASDCSTSGCTSGCHSNFWRGISEPSSQHPRVVISYPSVSTCRRRVQADIVVCDPGTGRVHA